MSFLIGVTFFKFINDEESKDVWRNQLIDIEGVVKGLRQDDVNSVFDRASRLIEDKNCREILVIGTAKQDEIEFYPGIQRYLKATSDQIVAHRSGFHYKRMTALDLSKDVFIPHLQACLAHKKDNDIGVMFLEDFSPAFTYLIIDCKFLMVSITHDGPTPSRLCLFTENCNSGIITEFRNHFLAVWDKEINERSNTPVSNLENFNKVYDYQSQAATQIGNLKTEINSFTDKKGLFLKHSLKKLENFTGNFSQFGDGVLKVMHESHNENLIRLFVDYLGFLQPGDRYRTVTFCSFWENLFFSDELMDDFVDANSGAIEKNVILERLFVIDKKDFDSKAEYRSSIRRIIEKNHELMINSSYKFRILFTSQHNKYQEQGYNFALVDSHDPEEFLVFKPVRTGGKNKIITHTELSFRDLESYNRCNGRLQALVQQAIGQDEVQLHSSLNIAGLTPNIIDKVIMETLKH